MAPPHLGRAKSFPDPTPTRIVIPRRSCSRGLRAPLGLVKNSRLRKPRRKRKGARWKIIGCMQTVIEFSQIQLTSYGTVLLFLFAGSSHPKYTNYLLEFTCSIELESSKELRNTILRATLINLSGREGCFSAADLMQEYFNRLLEAIVEKKGVEYGEGGAAAPARISSEMSYHPICTTSPESSST
ncbi:hypothetical protein FA13DRAFT_1712405 [Coprinellus micaceus]|uniref:DUF6589 domain-containing protein n=1 Tax=Coprinellus micaceus TaxID=71717 RepID=A0A4Y7T2D0_COPMI|nr:hypothetical protein FA13DRAFT_1712405 [Coprinellus micaceus]